MVDNYVTYLDHTVLNSRSIKCILKHGFEYKYRLDKMSYLYNGQYSFNICSVLMYSLHRRCTTPSGTLLVFNVLSAYDHSIFRRFNVLSAYGHSIFRRRTFGNERQAKLNVFWQIVITYIQIPTNTDIQRLICT